MRLISMKHTTCIPLNISTKWILLENLWIPNHITVILHGAYRVPYYSFLTSPKLSSYFPLPSFSPKPFFLLFPPSLFPTPPSPSQHIEEGDYLTPGQVKWAVPPLREQDLQGSAHTLHLKEQTSVTGRERVNQCDPCYWFSYLQFAP